MKVLVFAAHPDDEVLGLGGTLIKLKEEGSSINVCFVTDGGGSRYSKKQIRQHKINAEKCNEIIGTKEIFWLEFPDQKLDTVPLVNIVNNFEKIIEKVKPDIIFTHHAGDLNLDHQIVFNATITAARPIFPFIKKILSYETPSSTEWCRPSSEAVFIPNVFVNIEGFFQKKIKAFSMYDSEFRTSPHPRSKENLEALSIYRGSFAGMKKAEGFELIKAYNI